MNHKDELNKINDMIAALSKNFEEFKAQYAREKSAVSQNNNKKALPQRRKRPAPRVPEMYLYRKNELPFLKEFMFYLGITSIIAGFLFFLAWYYGIK